MTVLDEHTGVVDRLGQTLLENLRGRDERCDDSGIGSQSTGHGGCVQARGIENSAKTNPDKKIVLVGSCVFVMLRSFVMDTISTMLLFVISCCIAHTLCVNSMIQYAWVLLQLKGVDLSSSKRGT